MGSVLPKTWKLPDTISVRFGEQAGHQRMMEAEGHLLLILHKIPEPGNPERAPILYWRDPTGTWKSSEGGPGMAELKSLLDQFGARIDKFEERLQSEPTAEVYFDVVRHTTPLLRSMRNLHAAVQQARDTVRDDRGLIVARDRAAELERALELLLSDAKNGMEYMIARQAEEQAKTSHELLTAGHRLNLLIAIFLPLTALGSAFGMNMRHGLEGITTPLLFWGTLTAGLVLGLIVKTLLVRPGKGKMTNDQ